MSTINSISTGLERVIGDVVGSYSPSIRMHVSFNGIRIINGTTLKPSLAAEAPTIVFQGEPDNLYTLLIIDPDMPSPSDPTMKEYIHWIVTDIPGSGTVEQGKEILPYIMPMPHRGIHRYLVMMYEQLSPLGSVEAPEDRAHFDSKNFSESNELGDPKAIVLFCAKRESMPRRHHR
ncbi:Terminal flower 1 [Heracleum sosnowskyi]|uniref:Terminal flower 1 n=1 Tax=Heracleum sosnowskyi TaxID=360622 RepID=A0AAD8HS60_9APIA|nr:Terminal flower 1 [Heracleum sosnowskyi]